MSFTYPAVLYALALLSIPILIHLFNFQQYKVLRFTQVEFLKKINRESKSSSKLKHLLVLLARLLTFTCLIFAFSKPYLSQTEINAKPGKNGVCIYLDNSYSMNRNIEDGRLFDLAKQKAEAILKAYDEGDKFMLISNNFSSEEISWHNKSAFINKLQALSLTNNFRTASQIIARQVSLSKGEEFNLKYYFISDFQKNAFDYREIKMDSADYNLIPLFCESSQNINLDSLWFINPFQINQQSLGLNYKLKQFDRNEINQVEVKLYLNNRLKSPSTANIEGKDSIEKTINFKLDNQPDNLGKVYIKDYPINYDDTLYFNLVNQSKSKVLHIAKNSINSRLASVYQTDSFFVYQMNPIQQVDYSNFNLQDLIILDEIESLSSGLIEEIKKFVFQGGSLVIIPSANSDLDSYQKLSNELNIDSYGLRETKERKVTSLNEQAIIFKSVFEELPEQLILPKVKSYFPIKPLNSVFREWLLKFNTDENFLSSYEVEAGKVYLFSSPINSENSTFSEQAIFVPVLFNMALVGKKLSPSNYFIGNQAKISNSSNSEDVIHLKSGEFDLIPKQVKKANQIQIELDHPSLKAGHYRMVQNKKDLGYISLNYNRRESDVKSYREGELEDLLQESSLVFKIYTQPAKSMSQEIKNLHKGIQLWKYFLISALFFIGIEIALLRILK